MQWKRGIGRMVLQHMHGTQNKLGGSWSHLLRQKSRRPSGSTSLRTLQIWTVVSPYISFGFPTSLRDIHLIIYQTIVIPLLFSLFTLLVYLSFTFMGPSSIVSITHISFIHLLIHLVCVVFSLCWRRSTRLKHPVLYMYIVNLLCTAQRNS